MSAWAEKYSAIPFAFNGRSEEGVDCWGLVRLILKQEFNRDVPSLRSDSILEDGLAAYFNEARPLVSVDPVLFPFEGAIVVLKSFGKPMHVGLCVDEAHLIHIEGEKGVLVERLDSRRIAHRVEGYYDVQ